MRLVLSWLREFVDIEASAEEIAEKIGLRGFEVASIEALDGGDAVIDFEITANRPDCLSVLGLAREVATATKNHEEERSFFFVRLRVFVFSWLHFAASAADAQYGNCSRNLRSFS